MWSSWVKEKGTTQVMYIAKLKDGPKELKNFSIILKRVFKMVWWRGRKWNHIKKSFWTWSVFVLSKYWLGPWREQARSGGAAPPAPWERG
jgi:hypothetical protein